MGTLDEAIEHSAAPRASRLAYERLAAANANSPRLLIDDPALAAAFVAVTGVQAGRLTRLLETDPDALSVLGALDQRLHLQW